MTATSSAKAFDFYFVKMYNIYVTNKSEKSVYVRLQSQKISSLNESFHHELERLTGHDNPIVDSQPQQSVNSYLVRWGFCNIPANVTMPFAAEAHNDDPRMYASLYTRCKLWAMDYEVNCARYGCVFIEKKTAAMGQEQELYLSKTNPNPVWFSRRSGDLASGNNNITAGIDAEEGQLHFGRSSLGCPKPCKVTTRTDNYRRVFNSWKTVSGEEALSGELLLDTGHELVRTRIGDTLPPNAVIAGVSDSDGTLYLGRVGGNVPCAISTDGDRIKYFCFHADGVKQVESGEILVLTK